MATEAACGHGIKRVRRNSPILVSTLDIAVGRSCRVEVCSSASCPRGFNLGLVELEPNMRELSVEEFREYFEQFREKWMPSCRLYKSMYKPIEDFLEQGGSVLELGRLLKRLGSLVADGRELSALTAEQALVLWAHESGLDHDNIAWARGGVGTLRAKKARVSTLLKDGRQAKEQDEGKRLIPWPWEETRLGVIRVGASEEEREAFTAYTTLEDDEPIP